MLRNILTFLLAIKQYVAQEIKYSRHMGVRIELKRFVVQSFRVNNGLQVFKSDDFYMVTFKKECCESQETK